MTKHIKYFLFFLFLFGCGYTPIYEVNQKINFGLDEITYSGDKKIGRQIEKSLEKFRNNETKNIFNVDFESLKRKEVVTKDKKGDPSSYKLTIEVRLDLASKAVFKIDENKVRALIKTNEGRKSMREALGMDLELDPVTAIKRFWYLGELLELGEPEKVEISKEMKERAEIIKRYQKALTEIKKKLEEDKKEEEKKQKN